MHEGESPVGGVECGEEVGHGDQDGEAAAPSRPAVGRAEDDAAPHDLGGRHAGVEASENGLGRDQRQALLQPLLEPIEEGCTPGLLVGVGDDHPVAADLDGVGAYVVGEGIKGPSRGQVETGMVPMAGEQTLLDGAAMEGKAEMGAAVIDGEGLPLVPEHADPPCAHLGDQHAPLLQFAERPDIRASAVGGIAADHEASVRFSARLDK